MKRRFKNLLILTLSTVLLAAFSIRVYVVNEQALRSVVKEYESGEMVPLHDGFLTSADELKAGGNEIIPRGPFYIAVNWGTTLSLPEFNQRYGTSIEGVSGEYAENSILVLSLTLKNDGDDAVPYNYEEYQPVCRTDGAVFYKFDSLNLAYTGPKGIGDSPGALVLPHEEHEVIIFYVVNKSVDPFAYTLPSEDVYLPVANFPVRKEINVKFIPGGLGE